MSNELCFKVAKPVVPIVACLMPKFGIGFQGKLPWRLKQEMKYFKDVTTNTFDSNKRNAVLMGRKTWLSIPKKFRPLPGRLNVIVSRSNADWEPMETKESEVIFANNIEFALKKLDSEYEDIERIYIIGGGEVYNYSLKYATHLLLTEIETEKAVEMDTFLNTLAIEELFTKSHDLEEWKSFISPAKFTDNSVEEGDYKYRYSLYTKRV